MKVLLIDADCCSPNLALMKLSSFHKAKGDEVSLNFALGEYQKTYGSCVFPKNAWRLNSYPQKKEVGGSGIDLKKTLPDEIEFLCPDYSLYGIDYGLGFITRGCIRNCKFCWVPRKEGKIKFWQDPETFINPKSDKMVFFDNNFLAYSEHEKILQKIINKRWHIDFNQGLDIRLVNESNAELLGKIRWILRVRFAWDNIQDEKEVRRGIKYLMNSKIAKSRFQFYTLTGFNTTFEEDMYRWKTLRGLGVDPFVMLYEADNQPRLKIEFQRWANTYQISRHISFEKWLKVRKIKKENLPNGNIFANTKVKQEMA